jgi:hypothetical protein
MELFTEIYKKNLWGSTESVSGTGSTLKNTEDCHEAYPHYNDKCMILVKIQDMFSR